MSSTIQAPPTNPAPIYYLSTPGHGHTMKEVRRDGRCPPLRLRTYGWLFGKRSVPCATYIFTDFDRLGARDLEFAAAAYRQLEAGGATVLNDPARVRLRYALLRRLHEAGFNDFNVYRPDEGVRPARYPVFLRREHGHGSPIGDLLHGWTEVEAGLEAAMAAGIPRESLIIVEYAAEPVREGLFRKIGQFRIGGRAVPHLCVHEDRWLVKYGKLGSGGEALYREEREMMTGPRFAEEVGRAFEIAGIDYGRADFGLVDGRVQIYEINTNPDIKAGRDHPSPIRSESEAIFWQAYMDALGALARPHEPGRIRIDGPGSMRRRTRERRGRMMKGIGRRLGLVAAKA